MKLFSWGSNSHGQLGQGVQSEQTLFPTKVDFSDDIKCVIGGGKHSVIVSLSGKVYSCGDNDKGQLGRGPTHKSQHIFQVVLLSVKIIAVNCGWDFNLAISEDCQIYGWGSNSFGQLGLPKKDVKFLSAPEKIFDCGVCIAAGLRHSIVVNDKHTVFVSGFGKKGQLGLGNKETNQVFDNFTPVLDVKNVKKVACGESHSLVLTNDQRVFVWGDNRFGQLGINSVHCSRINYPTEVFLPLTDEIIDIFSGWTNSAALTDGGKVISWGRNDYGQLGETRPLNWKPELIKNIPRIKQLVVGSQHSVAITEGGKIMSWGWNEHGNCGNYSLENVYKPIEIDTEVNVMQVVIGAGEKSRKTSSVEMLEIFDVFRFPVQEKTAAIPKLDDTLTYSEFFSDFLVPNKPCIITGVTRDWASSKKWVINHSVNLSYMKENFGRSQVPISNCGKRVYNVQETCTMELAKYLDYWREYQEKPESMDCLYLKDWHFTREYPNEHAYRVPAYFASDWLNEYYTNSATLNDDYQFVYLGPKGSWTPLHADVFTSYSWSVNVCGRKRWLILPPGEEINLRNSCGDLAYDLHSSDWLDKSVEVYEVIQEEGEGIFIPSGWHHQVWNLENTLSINHNWINGCNILFMWQSLKKHLSEVKKEISDCQNMENWTVQCQLVLVTSFGIDYIRFYSFLVEIASSRIECLINNTPLKVNGNWFFGRNHLIFDLKQILLVLRLLVADPDVLSLGDLMLEKDQMKPPLEFLNYLEIFLS